MHALECVRGAAAGRPGATSHSASTPSCTALFTGHCPASHWPIPHPPAPQGPPFRLETESRVVEADAVIIATGAAARKLPIKGLEQYWNNGISACAVCDGSSPLFRCAPAGARLQHDSVHACSAAVLSPQQARHPGCLSQQLLLTLHPSMYRRLPLLSPLCSNKPVAVIGGGDVACEEALFLARYASKVYIVQRFDHLEVCG